MLASLLFPYDDDAPALMDGWLTELEDEDCIRRYTADGSRYLYIPKWLIHQKIDKPSKPQYPDPPDNSPNPREDSRDFGIGREGKGGEGRGGEQPATVVADQPTLAEPIAKTAPEKPARSAESAGARLPQDWRPDEELIAWARLERAGLDVSLEIEKFRDFWHAKAGADL